MSWELVDVEGVEREDDVRLVEVGVGATSARGVMVAAEKKC